VRHTVSLVSAHSRASQSSRTATPGRPRSGKSAPAS